MGRRVIARKAGPAQLVRRVIQSPGNRIGRQVAQRIGAQFARHRGKRLFFWPPLLHEPRREQFRDRRHINAVKTRRDNRRASHAHMNFSGPTDGSHSRDQHPHRSGTNDRILHEQDTLPLQHFSQWRVLRRGLIRSRATAFDESPPRIAIANQPLRAGNPQPIGHRVGCAFAGIRHRHNDRVLIDGNVFEACQLFPECFAGQVNALPVHAYWRHWQSRSIRKSNGLAVGSRQSARC